MTEEQKNDIFYVCSLIEYIASETNFNTDLYYQNLNCLEAFRQNPEPGHDPQIF